MLSISPFCVFCAFLWPILLFCGESVSMKRMALKGFRGGYGFIAIAVAVLLIPLSLKPADTLPAQIPDAAFWRMVTGFSEEAGSFRFQYMSNEREFAALIPELKKSTKPGGVYLGVGPEQNFSYIAALRPRIAFIFGIRRENMLEHLIYKAVFEMSANRAEFISRLFSRGTPGGLSDKSTVSELFEAFGRVPRDAQLFTQNLQAMKDHLMKDRRFLLTRQDQSAIDGVYRTFFDAGPGIPYPGRNFGGFFYGGSYADLMTATDDDGQPRSYLASEDNFQFLREMHKQNLIVPLVGDFAGTKAIRAAAGYLKEHQATVTTFYTSNVEQYLFEQADDWQRFYTNLATLPLDSSSTLIRSSHFAPAGARLRRVRSNYVMLWSSIADLVKAFKEGRIQNYYNAIQMSHE